MTDHIDLSYVADNYRPGMLDLPEVRVPRPVGTGPFDAVYAALAAADDECTDAHNSPGPESEES